MDKTVFLGVLSGPARNPEELSDDEEWVWLRYPRRTESLLYWYW